MNWIVISLLAFSLLACANKDFVEDNSRQSLALPVDQDSDLDESIVQAQEKALSKVEIAVVEASPENQNPMDQGQEKEVEPPRYQMDTKNHIPKVKKWIRYYSEKDRERFQRFLNRGAQYKTVIQDLLVTNGLPPDLYYLGILESGYVTKAVSHAGAVGPWQFMAPTGREYGLKINDYVDERQDTLRSTLAAIKYLKELYRQKKSWSMALAAYNAGPGRVRRAMRRGGSRNYWKLTRRRLLPYDTREYIPQFLAILSIGKNPERYGFVEKPEKVFLKRELVKVPSPVKLSRIAKLSGSSLKELQSLNPHLLKGMTPPSKKKSYHLWVPHHQVAQVEKAYSGLKAYRIAGLKATRKKTRTYRTRIHKVRRGQNLSQIARYYGTSIRKIKKINRLRSSKIYVGQKLRVKTKKNKTRKLASLRKKTSHRVRRGDTLSGISRKYGVSLSTLRKINGLHRSRIFVGQKLRLKKKKSVASRKTTKKYRIRRGDNLSKIARRFGMTIRHLKKMNNLKSNRILKGQTLKVASKSSVL